MDGARDETTSPLDDAASAAVGAGPPCVTDSIVLAVRPTTSTGVVDLSSDALEAFHPSTGAVKSLGLLDCSAVQIPVNGLAVDRDGGLYASNLNGVYRVESDDRWTKVADVGGGPRTARVYHVPEVHLDWHG
jgi:hypothetical protein